MLDNNGKIEYAIKELESLGKKPTLLSIYDFLNANKPEGSDKLTYTQIYHMYQPWKANNRPINETLRSQEHIDQLQLLDNNGKIEYAIKELESLGKKPTLLSIYDFLNANKPEGSDKLTYKQVDNMYYKWNTNNRPIDKTLTKEEHINFFRNTLDSFTKVKYAIIYFRNKGISIITCSQIFDFLRANRCAFNENVELKIEQVESILNDIKLKKIFDISDIQNIGSVE